MERVLGRCWNSNKLQPVPGVKRENLSGDYRGNSLAVGARRSWLYRRGRYASYQCDARRRMIDDRIIGPYFTAIAATNSYCFIFIGQITNMRVAEAKMGRPTFDTGRGGEGEMSPWLFYANRVKLSLSPSLFLSKQFNFSLSPRPIFDRQDVKLKINWRRMFEQRLQISETGRCWK